MWWCIIPKTQHQKVWQYLTDFFPQQFSKTSNILSCYIPSVKLKSWNPTLGYFHHNLLKYSWWLLAFEPFLFFWKVIILITSNWKVPTLSSLEHSLTFTDGSDWEVNAGQSRFDKTVSGRPLRLCFWDNKKIGKLKSTGKTEQTPAYTFLRTHSLLLRRTKKNILRYSDENWINLLKTRFQAGFTR